MDTPTDTGDPRQAAQRQQTRLPLYSFEQTSIGVSIREPCGRSRRFGGIMERGVGRGDDREEAVQGVNDVSTP